MARSICADYFKKGSTAQDALRAYGMTSDDYANWQIAIEQIAFAHCQKALLRAAWWLLENRTRSGFMACASPSAYDSPPTVVPLKKTVLSN